QLSSSAYPDKEDLNRDNVIQTTEQYYEYTMPLQPGQLNVGGNSYITDKVTNTVNGDQVTWYQFRVPIRQPGRVQGNGGQPFGFKNIRFMRLYMTGWQQPVVLRMVQPQFVANQWRQYASRIVDPRIQVPGIGNATDADAFAVSTVSVEENGPSVASVSPTGAIPYIVPPNITRDVEYLEFWLMDPFIKGANSLPTQLNREGITTRLGTAYGDDTQGGNLILNLGNVSEDVLRDQGQHEFENGLPVPGDPAGTTSTTPFGVVTNQQFLLDAFNAAPGARASQDIGLDGLTDAGEQTQFGALPGYAGLADPSNDNFRHHLDPSYNTNSTQILGRYKDYDNYEGNSPENSQLSSSAYPDKEDLNRDNVIQTTEQYYEYTMPLQPGQLNVG
ncbi:MAG: hypothetical protein EOO62_35360, partial [Hymenobacter sp.]